MKSKISKKMIIRVIVIAAVIIIPVLYSYFYLGAFWDPYSRLETLPVAVVNNDEGAIINNKERNVGQDMCDELQKSAALKFEFTNENTAKKGTEGKDYYAMIVIPKNFSKDIASSSTTDKNTATITYSPNEKRNYLASQILKNAVLEVEESIRSTVDSEIIDELTNKIKEVPDQMTELEDGLNQLKDGSDELKDGTNSLVVGTQTFSDKFSEYQNGISGLKDGSDTLTTGASGLDSGIQKLLDGANQLTTSTKDLDQLTTGAQTLATGAQQLNVGLIAYTSGVDSLISTVSSTSSFLTQYVTTVNPSIMKDQVFASFITKLSNPRNAESIATLQSASAALKEASQQISTGAQQLSTGCDNLPQLKKAIATLSTGLSQAKSGSTKLAEGSKALSEGLSTADDATAKLTDATTEIADGAVAVNDGTAQLSEGIDTVKSSVSTAITDTNDQLDALDGLSEYAKAPVTIEKDPIAAVPNYGTAFAPYFMSLSLWVGALIMFVGIYLDSEGKFKILTNTSEHKLARSFIYLLIGFAQAILLALVIQYSLGLEVKNPLLYYASCCLVSMVFIAIVQFLMVHLKDAGKFLSILLLILQLTSCAGTFPMETVPKLFNVLYPYMPMTYSVGLFKEAISGSVSSDAAYNAVILLIILVVFMAITIILSVLKARRTVRVKKEQLIEA